MNNLMPRLKTAIALPGYKLLLEFEDGVNGEINLSLFKGNGVFEFWNDERNFINFKITENKKIEWNEDVDMDPDSFYLTLINKTFEEYVKIEQVEG